MGQVSGPSRFVKHALAVAVASVPAAGAAQTFTVTTLAPSGAGSLSEAITSANGALGTDEIVFDVSGTISLGASSLPTITDDLSISGTVTLDGGGNDSAGPVLQANIDSDQLSLSGLRFRNAPRGAVHVDVSEGGSVSLAGLSMVAVMSENIPGLEPLVRLSGATASIEDVRIERNTLSTPAIVTDGGTLTITNSLVSGNTSSGGAAALAAYEGAVVTVADSRILGNTNTGAGAGAIRIANSSLTVTDAELSGNEAASEALASDGTGGAVYAYDSDLVIAGSTVSGNAASGRGGALDIVGGSLGVDDTVFTSNSVGWAYGAGGAVSVEGSNATVASTRFEKNRAALGGGFRAADSAVSVIGSYFSGNTSSAGAALAMLDGASLVLQESAITGNTVVDGLLPDTVGGGGLLAINASDITAENSIIRNNSSSKYGGGLFAAGVDTLLLSDTTIAANSALVGGSMAISSSPAITLERVVVANNTATGAGGAIFASVPDDGTAQLVSSTFSDNRSRSGATAFLTLGSSASLDIDSVTLSGNRADAQSVLLVSGTGDYATLTVENTTISGNEAINTRAAIVLENVADASLTNVTAIDNRASLPAGTQIYVPGRLDPDSPPALTIEQSVLSSGNQSEVVLGGSGLSSYGGYGLDLWLDVTLTGNFMAQGYTPAGANAAIDDTFGGLPVDPQLGALANNGGYTRTHAPDVTSPVIDQGESDRPDVMDQRGVDQAGSADLGAVEYVPNRAPVLKANLARQLAVAPGKVLAPRDVAAAFEDPDGDDVTVVSVRGLPPGLYYDEPGFPGKGVITGVPEQSGRYRVTVEVTDDGSPALMTVAVAEVVIGGSRTVVLPDDDDGGGVPLAVLALSSALAWLRRRRSRA